MATRHASPTRRGDPILEMIGFKVQRSMYGTQIQRSVFTFEACLSGCFPNVNLRSFIEEKTRHAVN